MRNIFKTASMAGTLVLILIVGGQVFAATNKAPSMENFAVGFANGLTAISREETANYPKNLSTIRAKLRQQIRATFGLRNIALTIMGSHKSSVNATQLAGVAKIVENWYVKYFYNMLLGSAASFEIVSSTRNQPPANSLETNVFDVKYHFGDQPIRKFQLIIHETWDGAGFLVISASSDGVNQNDLIVRAFNDRISESNNDLDILISNWD